LKVFLRRSALAATFCPLAAAWNGVEARVAARLAPGVAAVAAAAVGAAAKRKTPPKWVWRLCGARDDFSAKSRCLRGTPPAAAHRDAAQDDCAAARDDAATAARDDAATAVGSLVALPKAELLAPPSPPASSSSSAAASSSSAAAAAAASAGAEAAASGGRLWMALAICSGHWSLRRWWTTSRSTKFKSLLSRVPTSSTITLRTSSIDPPAPSSSPRLPTKRSCSDRPPAPLRSRSASGMAKTLRSRCRQSSSVRDCGSVRLFFLSVRHSFMVETMRCITAESRNNFFIACSCVSCGVKTGGGRG
jgi:hypothetical protein